MAGNVKNLLFNMFNCFLLTLFCTCCAPNYCSFYCSLVANIALKHAALGSTNFTAKGNPLANAATDGKYLLGSPPCFYSKYKGKASWVTDLGPNNRVAMVLIYLQKELADVHKWNGLKDIDIYVGQWPYPPAPPNGNNEQNIYKRK